MRFCALSSLLPGTLVAGSDQGSALHIHCLDVGQEVRAQMTAEEAIFLPRWAGQPAMADFLFAAAAFVLAMVALGLVRILRGPTAADRIMAAQLLGSGGIATLLLIAAATGMSAATDVALSLALLAAFASIAFVHGMAGADAPDATDRG
jgi:multicomponent Na+:H+ antiporter subunit F